MELWTIAHAKTILPALAVMVALCMVLRKFLGKKDLKIRMIPLQIVAILLVVMEIGKQWVSFSRGYDLYHIPLHFCSLFLFVLPVMAFYRGKYANRVAAIGAALCGATFWLIIIYPSLIYSAGNIENFFGDYLDFHTVAFHNLVMLAFLLILFLELHSPEAKGEPKIIVIFLTCFCTIAAIVSQLLKTNYAGFYSCNVPPIEDIRLSLQPVLGYALTQIIYVVGLMLVHYSFVLGFYWLYRLLRRLLVRPDKALTVL